MVASPPGSSGNVGRRRRHDRAITDAGRRRMPLSPKSENQTMYLKAERSGGDGVARMVVGKAAATSDVGVGEARAADAEVVVRGREVIGGRKAVGEVGKQSAMQRCRDAGKKHGKEDDKTDDPRVVEG